MPRFELVAILVWLSAAQEQLRGKAVPDYTQCGIVGNRKRYKSGIVHGRDAAQCVWRWQVSLRNQREDHPAIPFCGGTLIAPGWVLTAAHCTANLNVCQMRRLRVVAGDFNQFSDDEAANGISVERRVQGIYTQPMYNKVTSDFDFALVELDKEVPISDCIGVACLPKSADETGMECSITGWGTLMSSGPSPELLQEAPVKVLDNSRCERDYAETNESITSSMLCASGRSQSGITDTCQGDSGGPLVCKESGQYVLRGVTSWGDGCGLEGFPGVYARVTSASEWMHDVMASDLVASDQDDETRDFHGMMWAVVHGPCTMDESGCIQSPNFPANYTMQEACTIAVNVTAAVPIQVQSFSTERAYDALLVNCKAYSGRDGPQGVIPDSNVYWLSDGSVNAPGWKICPGIES